MAGIHIVAESETAMMNKRIVQGYAFRLRDSEDKITLWHANPGASRDVDNSTYYISNPDWEECHVRLLPDLIERTTLEKSGFERTSPEYCGNFRLYPSVLLLWSSGNLGRC